MELRDYQKRIANWLTKHPRACLSVGMGLGKTAAVLHFINHTMEVYPGATFLIVAPKRVAETVWMQEAEKWQLWKVLRNMSLVAGDADAKARAAADGAPIHIVSRDNLKYFENAEVDVLVIDELTSFKNMDAQRTRQVMSIKAARRIGMTGTFAPNGMIDVYAQLACLGIASPDKRDFYAWRGRWFKDVCKGRGVKFSHWVLSNATPEDVIAPFARDIITMTTDDYLRLPAVMYSNVEVELTRSERTAYDDLVATLHFELPEDLGGGFAVSEKARFAKVQTLCSGFVYDEDGTAIRIPDGGAKVQAAVEFCRRAAAEGESVLLFLAYRETAVWFGELATAAGLRIASVKGWDNEWLAKWNDGELDVLVANPAGAGHGLNLQHGGHIVLWLELTYNFEFYAQANARLHRTGQTKPVQVWHLIARDTVDEGVLHALKNKGKTNARVENATKVFG